MDDFSVHSLRMLNFNFSDRSITTETFAMCGTRRVWAKVDIAVLDDAECSLMVQKDRVSCRWIFIGHVPDESPADHSDR